MLLPKVLNIPGSFAHILTPLPQGVTHVGVYVHHVVETVVAVSDDVGSAGEVE